MNKQLVLETTTRPKALVIRWQQIEDALCRLNGDAETWVSLEFVGDGSLVAGGGNNGRYLVVHSFGPDSEQPTRTLVDPSLGGPDIEINTSQGLEPYPARICVHLSAVLHAFRYFYKHGGQPDPMSKWQNDW